MDLQRITHSFLFFGTSMGALGLFGFLSHHERRKPPKRFVQGEWGEGYANEFWKIARILSPTAIGIGLLLLAIAIV
jgi:hypothetical protein